MSTCDKVIVTMMIILTLVTGCEKVQPTDTPAPATEPPAPSLDTPVPDPDTPVPPAGSTAQSSTPVPAASQIFDIPWNNRAIFRQGLIEAEQDLLDNLPGATVYHIDMQISDDMLLLKGQQAVHYTNGESEPLDDIYFRLFPNTAGGKSTVSEVKVNDEELRVDYGFQDSALRVPLPTSLQPGKEIDIQMNFEVEIAQEMAGNYGLFGYFDGVLVLDEFYPVIPVYDDEGWNVETPPPNGDLTHFDTSFYLVRATVPANLTVVASGIQVGRETDGENQTLTFAAGPMRDFYLAASEHFTVLSETMGETRINSYAFPEQIAGAELALQVTIAAFKSFNERLGLYPYVEFDVVSTPMQALGMEYPAITGITLRAYDPNETVSGLPSQVILESTVAHEVAHQWFYSTVGNDQVDEPWLDEALVQYLTGRYYADTYGETAAQGVLDGWAYRWDRVDRAEIPIGLPSAAYAEAEYGAIVYGRGPIFVTALAKEMGRETFNEFLRDYYQSHKWGIGTGNAFRQLAEAHCQCDLNTLFEEWVYEK